MECSALQEGKASEASQAASKAEELNATIQQLQDALAAETRSRQEQETDAARAAELQKEIERLQDLQAAAVKRGRSNRSQGKGGNCRAQLTA